jgi:tight adherence protein B
MTSGFLVLAQDEIVTIKPGEWPPAEISIYVITFLACVVFVITGYSLFSAGWESYEEKYIEGAERTLDDLFITIPPQQLIWLAVFGLFFGFAVGMLFFDSVMFGIVFGAAGGLAPRFMLNTMKKRRADKFKEQLVESLITLTNALRSGFSLPKAFQLIAHDMPKPICQEFGILVQELRLGIDVEEGLRNMHKRLPSEDLDLVVTSVAISNSVGGNLAEVFDKIGDTIRERRRIEGRIEALTAQGKMQGIVVSALPLVVAMAINWIDPNLMAPMYTTIPGYIMIGAMVIMEFLGYFFIKMIVNIEV